MKRKILKTKHTVKSLIVFSLLILTQNLLLSQVLTRILGEDEFIYDHVPWYFPQSPNITTAPIVDVQAVLSQDSVENRELPRLGVKQVVNLDETDGGYYEFGNYTIWKLFFSSVGATDLGFKFSNAVLPEGSQMFIYSLDTRFLIGPVLPSHFQDGVFNSDFLTGDKAIVEVFLPQGSEGGFSITVEEFTHGIVEMNKAFDEAFGDSDTCNVNTACPAGANWGNEINAVCKIIHSSIGSCTGTLINNDCNDFTPFVLTADHCVKDISDLLDFVFRFNYESPTCPPGNSEGFEPHPSLWITFSGAQFRSAWEDTDFALLQLNASVAGESGLGFAGWDRSTTTPANSTIIHHPAGDVKKITFDSSSPTIDPSPPTSLPLTANNSFKIILKNGQGGDFGILEGGSSGSAEFNENQLIVGQLSGGTAFAECADDSLEFWFGRFSSSWTGGGSNSSRLSNWLGGTNNPVAIGASSIPFIAGSNILCTTPKDYALHNPVAGYSTSWSVSPASLFGSPTSGSGATTTLWAANSSSQGWATLTFTLENTSCGAQVFTKSIWVGKPLLTGITVPDCFDPGENYSLVAQAVGATSYVWSFPACPNGPPTVDPDPDCWFNYTGNAKQVYVYTGKQGGSISVWASNECGTSSINVPIGEFCDDTPGEDVIFRSSDKGENEDKAELMQELISIFPNPSNEVFTVKLNDTFYEKGAAKNIILFCVDGRPVQERVITANSTSLDISNLSRGIYYIRVFYNSKTEYRKVIIQ